MANLRASDNPFPSILIEEGTEPTAPAAGHQRLYIDSTSHDLMIVDSTGAESAVGGSAGLTDPMTTRGDIIIRNASNVTDRLARGSASQVLTSDGTDIAWATPTAVSAPPLLGTPVAVTENAFTNGTSIALTVAAPSVGNRLVAIVGSTGRVCNSITQTNVTWTQRLTSNGNSRYCEIWTGVVSASAGTTATAAFTGTNDCAMTYLELPSTFPAFTTAGTPIAATSASATVYAVNEPILTTAGDYYFWAVTAGQASSYTIANQPHQIYQGGTGGYFRCGMMRSHGGPLTVVSINVAANAYRMILVKLS